MAIHRIGEIPQRPVPYHCCSRPGKGAIATAEDMSHACDPICRLRQVQPQGPYHLIGYSFGGTVVYIGFPFGGSGRSCVICRVT
ncbi:thioesterase domain-containing protein [Vibrio sp. PP-XX7]